MEILGALLSIVFGALGYLFVTFLFQPILRYRDLKSRIISDLVFYSNVIQAEKDLMSESEPYKNAVLNKIESMRRHASDLVAFSYSLPLPYIKLLNYYKEYPEKASFELVNLANTSNLIEGMFHLENICTYLKIDFIDKLFPQNNIQGDA